VCEGAVLIPGHQCTSLPPHSFCLPDNTSERRGEKVEIESRRREERDVKR